MSESGSSDGETTGRGRRILRSIAIIVVGIGLLAAIAAIVRGRDWAEAEHRDNYQQLDIVGKSLESWPSAVEALARGNLFPERIQRPPSPELGAPDTWQAAARFENPQVGTMQLLYRIGSTIPSDIAEPVAAKPTDPKDCTEPLGKAVDFVRANAAMRISGILTLAGLWQADREVAANADASGAPDYQALVKALDPGALFGDPAAIPFAAIQKPVFCYQLSLPLQRIANINSNAPLFRDIVVVGADGKVITSLGGAPLPVSGLQDFVPDTAEYRKLVTSLLVAASQSKGADGKDADAQAQQAARQAQQSGNPLEVSVAGQGYVAYFRPVRFPEGWMAQQCRKPDVAGAAAGSSASPGGASSGLLAPGDSCLLIGLVPQKEVRARVFRLSPDLVAGFGTLLVFIIVLVPVTKLRFLGPAGDMSKVEVGISIFGLLAASAIVTLAALSMANALLLRARSDATLELVSERLAKDFRAELREATEGPVRLARLLPERAESSLPRAGQAVVKGTRCKFADGSDVPSLTLVEQEEYDPFLPVPRAPVKGARPAGADRPETRWEMEWPKRASMAAFGELGRAFPGLLGVAFRCNSGGRAKVDQRQYFKRAMAGDTDGQGREYSFKGLDIDKGYVIDAVRSQPDGFAQVIVANRFGVPNDTGAIGPRSGVLLQSFTARTFLSPVLPRSFHFIVVNASDPQLPYLFSSAAHQIGVVSLRETLPSQAARNAIAMVAATDDKTEDETGKGSALTFTAPFEGVKQDFVARKLAGTPWVLLTYRPVHELDQTNSEAVGMAAVMWLGLVLVLIPALLAILYFAVKHFRLLSLPKGRVRLWLWPRPGMGEAMHRIGTRTLAASLLAFVVIALFGHGLALAAMAIIVPCGAILFAVWQIARAEPDADPAAEADSKALLPADERGFRIMLAGLLLACGSVPAAAMWADARGDARDGQISAEIVHLKEAWVANRLALDGVERAYGLMDQKPGMVPLPPPWSNIPELVLTFHSRDVALMARKLERLANPVKAERLDWPGLFGFDPGAGLEDVSLHVRAASLLRHWAGLLTGGPGAWCRAGMGKPLTVGGFCVDTRGTVGPGDDRIGISGIGAPWAGNLWWPGVVGMLVVLVALVWVLLSSCQGMMRALFGFGIPLDAVTHPRVLVENGKPKLPPSVVVLNGPMALKNALLGGGDPLDLSQSQGKGWQGQADIARHMKRIEAGLPVVVMGLDIALKDAKLRLEALPLLERLSDRAARKAASENTDALLVVMTDLSPLDRILRAYEREQDNALRVDPAAAAIPRTEQMRWSKLFEDFKTVTLPVQPKFLWGKDQKTEAREELKSPSPGMQLLEPNEVEGALELIREVRFLPEAVLKSLIEPPTIPGCAQCETKPDGSASFPIAPETYHAKYFRHVVAWAKSVRPATRQAACDYLRGELIEHYQHMWAASSHAERVLLDNLARGQVINIEAALAMRSLIRRHLVVLDPAPRIVNDSFALFVKQAEKPETVKQWRRDQPGGLWDKFARPLGYLLPAAVAVLAGLALLAGESLTTVLPILFGTGPALLATILPGRRA